MLTIIPNCGQRAESQAFSQINKEKNKWSQQFWKVLWKQLQDPKHTHVAWSNNSTPVKQSQRNNKKEKVEANIYVREHF